ncbi:MAG: RNA polymerase Rpb4 family protein [Methanosarcinales archaeon]|jgi:DNA-directed RNA polymerase subunit F|nr:RNA polymerase Rpb4 family protein [Methanosarcinales archaeon]
MIVKEVVNEELLTLAEVRELLTQIMEERREESDEEQVYEFRKALNHAEIFSKLSASDAKELVAELLKLEKMRPAVAVRITDILPASRDELRSIYAKEKFTLKDEELDAILDVVRKYA